jgi:2-polyprenyl-3-methyl-5-hydroxy-6-metoxy-1,4-benzoquinol methylase
MDDMDVPFEEYHQCLSELERINILTWAYRPILKWLENFKKGDRLSILDVGYGGGDMLRRLARTRRPYSLHGVDLHPASRRSAELRTAPSDMITYHTGEAFHFSSRDGIDIIISSLTAHHMNDEQLILLLQWMDATARRGWIINDLHRHPVAYYFIKCVTRFFSRNRMIRHDAAVSVAKAFTFNDWRRLLNQAQVAARMEWHFPFRICVSCVKPL